MFYTKPSAFRAMVTQSMSLLTFYRDTSRVGVCSDLKESVRISCCEVSQNSLKEKMSPQQDHGSYRAHLTWWLIVHLSPCSLQANLPAPIALSCHIISVSVAKDLWSPNSSRHSSATEMQSWHHHSSVRLPPQTCERGTFCGVAASLSMLLCMKDAENTTDITSPYRETDQVDFIMEGWRESVCSDVNWEVHAEQTTLFKLHTDPVYSQVKVCMRAVKLHDRLHKRKKNPQLFCLKLKIFKIQSRSCIENIF